MAIAEPVETRLSDESAVALTVPTGETDPDADTEGDAPLDKLAAADAVASASVALPLGLVDGDPVTESAAVGEDAELGDASAEALAIGDRVNSLENDVKPVADALPDAVATDSVAVAVVLTDDTVVGVTVELTDADAVELFDGSGVCEIGVVGLGLKLPATLRETDGDELSVVFTDALFAAVLDASTLPLIDEELVSDRDPEGVPVTRIDADDDRETKDVPERTVVLDGEREMSDDGETEGEIVPELLTSDVALTVTLRELSTDSLSVTDWVRENAPVPETRRDAVRGLDAVAAAVVDGGADTLEPTVTEEDGDASPVSLEVAEKDGESVGVRDAQLLEVGDGVCDTTALVVSLTVEHSDVVAVTTEDAVTDAVDSAVGVPLPVCFNVVDAQAVSDSVTAVDADDATEKLLEGVDDGEREAIAVELGDADRLASFVVVTETLGDRHGDVLSRVDGEPTAEGDAIGELESMRDSVALAVAHALDETVGSTESDESGDVVAAAVKLDTPLIDADTDALPDTVRVINGVSVPVPLPELTGDTVGCAEMEGELLEDMPPLKELVSDALAEIDRESGAVPVATIVAVSRGDRVPVTDETAEPDTVCVGIGLADAQLLAEIEPLALRDADEVLLPRGVAL